MVDRRAVAVADLRLRGNQAAMATGARSFPEASHHLYVGPVGSGKSLMGLIDFFAWTATLPRGAICGILSPTHSRITGLLAEHADLFGYIPPRTGVQSWHWNGRTFELRPLETPRSAARIRGSNWFGAFVDEGTLGDRGAFSQVESRLRKGRWPKLWITSNPAGPAHWLRRNYLHPQRPGVHVVESQIADNPSLPAGYLDRIGLLYRGAMYERMVKGRWVAAAGEIWLVPSDVAPPLDSPTRVSIGVDDARSGIAFAVALGQWGDTDQPWYAIGEWVKPAGLRMEAGERAEAITAWAVPRWGESIERVWVDPSAADLIVALRHEGLRALAAENPVLVGVSTVDAWFTSERLLATSAVPQARAAWEAYEWNPRQADLGEDRPRKSGQEHACDALRYVVMGLDRGTPRLIW